MQTLVHCSGALYPYRKVKETHVSIDFLMVSGIARGRVRTTTATAESRKITAILLLIGYFDIGQPCYGQLIPVKSNQGIRCFQAWNSSRSRVL